MSYFLIKGKDEIMRTFHNVCRHRAYSITRKDIGATLVLGCKYHGWSYDTRGRLLKAPQFENVEGFDKSQNGLFEIRTQVDDAGRIWINFDAREGVIAPKSDHDSQVARQLVESWVVEGNFNWKAAGICH